MSSLSMIRLVMAREIHQRVRSRGFKVTTAFLCIAVLGAGLLSRTISGDDSPTRYDVGIVGLAPKGFTETIDEVAQALHMDVTVSALAAGGDFRKAVRDGDFDAVVDVAEGTLIAEREPPDQLAAVLSAGWQASASEAAAKQAGLDDEQVAEILSPAGLRTSLLGTDNTDDENLARLVGMVTAVLLFISVNAFGGMVLTGVVEEKSTGVVEVLLAHVRAHQLLAGKVFGIGAVAMLQFSAALAAGVVALKISGTSVPGSLWIGLPTTILWFLVGFVLYSTLFALAGSFVSRQEDAQSAAAPISVVFTGAYLTVFVLGVDPTSTAARIVSVLPPFAPLVMPLRVSLGAASVAEIVIAAVLLLAATIGMLRLAGAVYGRTLLHRGSRLRWKQALRLKSN